MSRFAPCVETEKCFGRKEENNNRSDFHQCDPAVLHRSSNRGCGAGQVFRKLADSYFSEGEISWEQTEAWSLPAWQLTVRYPAWEDQSLEEFCGYLGEFAEFCMESDVFLRDGHVVNEFPAIDIQMEGNAAVNEFRYSIYGYPGYTREDFERELYEFLYLHSPETLEARIEQEHQEWLEESRSHIEENMASYLEMEPDAACKLENGREYRMLVTDYVMGDCFYILLGAEADGASAFLLNPDPFNQEMGYVQCQIPSIRRWAMSSGWFLLMKLWGLPV